MNRPMIDEISRQRKFEDWVTDRRVWIDQIPYKEYDKIEGNQRVK